MVKVSDCVGETHGNKVAHPYNQHKYRICGENNQTVMRCEDGLVWKDFLTACKGVNAIGEKFSIVPRQKRLLSDYRSKER